MTALGGCVAFCSQQTCDRVLTCLHPLWHWLSFRYSHISLWFPFVFLRWAHLHLLIGHFTFFSGEQSHQIFGPIFKSWIIYNSIIEVSEFFIFCTYRLFIWHTVCKNFPAFYGECLVTFLAVSLEAQKLIVVTSSLLMSLLKSYPRNHCLIQGRKDSCLNILIGASQLGLLESILS